MFGEAGGALGALDAETHGSQRRGQVPSESVGPESSDLGAGSQDSGMRLCLGARVGMQTKDFRESHLQDRAQVGAGLGWYTHLVLWSGPTVSVPTLHPFRLPSLHELDRGACRWRM